MQSKETGFNKLSKSNSQINTANKIRHYLLSMVKDELKEKKINKIKFSFIQSSKIEKPKITMSKSTNNESNDDRFIYDDDSSSSNDISCEEEELVYSIQKC